jgi:hypothetical protein
MPTPHTVAEVDEFKATIESLVDIESNSRTATVELKRPLSERLGKEIRRWIENEQALCAVDNGYFESRYAYVCDEQGRISKFHNRKSQEVFDSIVAEFDERQVSIEMLCLDPETKVLTADLRWRRIDDLQVGEEVVAVDEGRTIDERRALFAARQREYRQGIHRGRAKCHTVKERKMRTARIEAKWYSEREAVRITFDDGRTLVSSREHQFLCRQRGGVDPIWQKTEDIKLGDQVRYITRPWSEPTNADAWAGGIIDGEGSLDANKYGAEISITQTFNVVYDAAHQYLTLAGYNFNETADRRESSKDGKGKLGSKDVGRLHISRMDEVFRLIGQTRPVRFIDKRWWEGKCLPGKKSGIGWAHVIKIELLPKQRMIDIQTTARTFIAEGFVSHNCMKGRQVGITTKTALKFMHRLMFVPHTQAVMASVQADKSELIGRILDITYSHSPWWLIPRRLPKGKFDNGSVLSIQSGMQATGIAQGWTPTAIHISELADIPKPEKVIEEGLLRATHSSRNLFLVLEGTGGGNTGWLADTWRNAKRDYPKGQHRLRPIFLPWFTATDLYPEEDWVRKYPIPGSFMADRLDATRKHVLRCETFVRNTDYLKRVFGGSWTMPIEQQWFWEFNYRQAVNNHTQKIWMAQMPADDFEALTGKHDSIFSPEIIDELERNIYEIRVSRKTGEETKVRRSPVEAFAITGHDIDEAFYPREEEIDEDKPITRVNWYSHRGREYQWEMIPLLWLPEDREENVMDRLLVYEHPERWNKYTLGIDTADGLGKEDEERTVLSLAKNRYHGGFDEQVAEFTSNRLNAAQAVAFAACIGAYYGRAVADNRGVMYAIEQVGRPGETCQHQLKMMGFHHHYKPKRFDSKKIKEEIGHKEGWWSSTWSVPILMTRFVEAVNGGWYIPKSKWQIEELKTLERRQAAGKSKMVHRSGQFDDRVRAAAQSFFCAHDLDVLADRAQQRYAGPAKEGDSPKIRQAGQISVGGWD